MEARQEAELPRGPGWQFEPKWDGFRCLAIRDGDTVTLTSKSGKPLTRYFPDIVDPVRAPDATHFVLDGDFATPAGTVCPFEPPLNRLPTAAIRARKLA